MKPTLLILLATCLSLHSADKPNIIVILSDDYGGGSVGCYGATGVKTPHLDWLALDEGFTRPGAGK